MRRSRPGGCLVWHDFNSPVPWVKVREAIERLRLPDPVIHVGGTEGGVPAQAAPLPAPRMPGAARRCPPSGSDGPPSRDRSPGAAVRVAWEGEPAGPAFATLVNQAALPASC